MPEMIYKPLGNTGLNVSIIGFGAAPLGNAYGDVSAAESNRAVHYAIDHGINFFDTSPYYGKTLSETRLGEALTGGYRDKIILATKAGRYDVNLPDGFDFSPQRIIRSAEESLKRLQTDVIDVFQLHDVEFTHKEQIINESIPALYKLKQEGKVRFIGVTGYPIHLLREIIETADLDVVLSYCHYNLMITTLDDVLTPVARAKGMGLINASPLHMGVLTDAGAPAWHPAPEAVHHAAQQAARYCRDNGVSIITLAMQFALAYEDAATTVVGVKNEQEMEENLRVIGTSADPRFLDQLHDIIRPAVNVVWPSGLPENYEPDAVVDSSQN